jgi:hypothetical protein
MAAGRKARLVRSPYPQVHVIHREWVGTITKSAADSGFYRSWNLATFPSSDIVSMFMDYKIASIDMTYLLINAPNNNSTFPTLYLAPQHFNYGVAPASRDEVIQYKGIVTKQFGPAMVQYKKSFVPYAFTTLTGSGQAPVASPWLNTNNTATTHAVGVEWIDNYNSTSATTHTLNLVVRATILARGTR